MSAEFTEGQEISDDDMDFDMDLTPEELEELDRPCIIRFEKHPEEYGRDMIRSLVGTIFHSLHILDIRARVKEVFIGYLDLSYQGKPLPPGREMARRCGMTHKTYIKCKRELIKKGLIYFAGKGPGLTHRPSDPDSYYVRDFMVENLHQESGVKNTPNFDGVKNTPTLHAEEHVEGTDTGTKVLIPSLSSSSFPEKKIVNTLSSFQKESVTGEYDPGALDAAFADPPVIDAGSLSKDDAVALAKTFINNLTAGSGRAFRLTPPNQKLTKPKKKRGSGPVQSELLDRVIKFCYGIETTQQWLTVDRVTIGRCSGAITKLANAGADLTRFDEFVKKWRAKGWMTNPAPEMVVRNWFKVMGIDTPKEVSNLKIDAIPQEIVEADETQERINAYLQQKARQRNQ
jgi:hypothetical protein